MRATSVLSLLFLILGQILLPTFATPVGQDAPMQIKRNYGVANKMASLPPIYQTISPPAPTATPSVNGTTSGDSGSDTQSDSGSKALNSVNAGVALAPRETLFFSVLGGVIATSLMF
jgi:hypothetical protein